MKRDYLGHAVTFILAVAASTVIAKCPPEPVPAGKPAPEVAPPVVAPAKVEQVQPAATTTTPAPVIAPEAKQERSL